MRLTLRTLLAYLDDILEPSQTKEIGTKLAESKFASDLVDRIREVMRRRRLTAPAVDGRDGGLDANLMAEYLDNTLQPAVVTEVEKRCLESDMHLAEAAASHQILTLVLGEPIEIDPESRRRMYGLVSQGSGDNHAAIAASRPASHDGKKNEEEEELAVLPQMKNQTETIGSALPDYLKPRPFWQRATVVAIPAAVLIVFIWTFATDPAYQKLLGKLVGMGGRSPAAAGKPAGAAAPHLLAKREPAHANASGIDKESEAKAAPPVATPTGDGVKKTVGPERTDNADAFDETGGTSKREAGAKTSTEKPKADARVTVTNPAAGATAKSAGANVGPAPQAEPLSPAPPVSPATSKAAPPAVATISPPPKPADSASTNGKTKASSVPPKTDQQPSPEPAPDVKLVSADGVLLGYDTNRADWFVVERPGLTLPAPPKPSSQTTKLDEPANPALKLETAPKAGVAVPSPPAPAPAQQRADQLAAPEPFDSQLNFGDGLCSVWLMGGTAVRLLAPSGPARFGIDIREGRVVIRSGESESADTPYRPFVIAIVVGGERGELWHLEFLKPKSQCGIEIVPGLPSRPGADAKETSYRGGLYVVSGEVRFTESVGRQRTLVADRWVSLAPNDRAVATDMAGATFHPTGTSLAWLNPETRHYSASQLKAGRDFESEFLKDQPVSLSIGTAAKSDPPKVSELAAKALALTGQYQELVETLAQSSNEETVHAAASGLRAWLPEASDHSALLQKELSSVFVPKDQQVVWRLLWGYNSDDARSLETSKQLVEWLDHDKLAVRVLAIDQISHLSGGQTQGYRAGMFPDKRKQIKKTWERYVERNKGLLRK